MITVNQLGDLEIREAFIAKLLASKQQPQAVIEELRVHNGNAIADIVTIHKEARCYEIKGDSDKIERAVYQSQYYDLSFRKITLITTQKHTAKALQMLPYHWGIIETKKANGKISFRTIRPTKVNKNFDKKIALLTLWRSELVNIAQSFENSKLNKQNRDDLTFMISQKLGRAEVNQYISSQLLTRKSDNA